MSFYTELQIRYTQFDEIDLSTQKQNIFKILALRLHTWRYLSRFKYSFYWRKILYQCWSYLLFSANWKDYSTLS